MADNKLFYGDNLDVLRRYVRESVDPRYLDPSFKSPQDYSVLFACRSVGNAGSKRLTDLKAISGAAGQTGISTS